MDITSSETIWKEEFGWLPIRHDYSSDDFTIATARSFDDAIRSVRTSGCSDEDWFWPPLASSSPPKPVRVFALPTTHEITVAGEYEEAHERLQFLVSVLGFLYGMLLTPGPWVNFYRVCINPSRWQDFFVDAPTCKRVLSVASDIWRRNPQARTALFGLVRWHTFALSYDHPFERFLTQYMVLDAAWHAHELLNGAARKALRHGDRINELCAFYNLALPSWWKATDGSLAIVNLRNELMHEARWGGAPLVFDSPKAPLDTVHLDLAWFNSRLILAVLGNDSEYTHSSLDGAGAHLLR